MKVLIAEDDPVSRRLLQAHLEKWGHEVTPATGGGDAWRLFQASPHSIVITDWEMPEIDGPELIRRIRGWEHTGYVYIILLTARAQTNYMVQGMEAGADDFVAKPFDREELRVRVRQGERIVRLEHTLAGQNLAVREAQNTLVQNEKLAGLGRLAAGVAHEVNNPIAFVSNNLTVLRRDTLAALAVLDAYRQGRTALESAAPALAAEAARLEEEADLAYFQENVAKTFDRSLAGLQRVRTVVQNLRDFARLDEAVFKDVDLNAALESVLEMLRYDIRQRGLRLEKHFSPLPLLPCQAGKLNQVFFNLLVNAVQACEGGGTITVRTRATTCEVVIEISDTGSGIKPEHLPHLFDPFFTTKPVGQGTGLGLSVSFGIVRDHHGTIEVESEVGRGSTFRIFLPLPARSASDKSG
jgi:signal transduction histidine kinase